MSWRINAISSGACFESSPRGPVLMEALLDTVSLRRTLQDSDEAGNEEKWRSKLTRMHWFLKKTHQL